MGGGKSDHELGWAKSRPPVAWSLEKNPPGPSFIFLSSFFKFTFLFDPALASLCL